VGVAALSRSLGAGGLLAAAALHLVWAAGFSWPAADRRRLARAVAGRDKMPSAADCAAVAALLTAGAGLVAGWPKGAPRLRRIGAGGVAATLAARGAIGAAGLMPEQRTSPSFARLDRRLYSPLCLLLAVLCTAGAAH